MRVLGIETSCDETSLAVVVDGKEIVEHVIRSQIDLHKEFGGVYPEIASREHFKSLIPLYQSMEETEKIDLIAVACAPGLMGSLLMGVTFAKALAFARGIPFVGVNHIEAHLYAAVMTTPLPYSFPALGLIISGGHTALIKIEGVGTYTVLGETLDDALGEALDKTGRLLDLPYPGGVHLETLAKECLSPQNIFRRPKVDGFNFSFSGMKTQALYYIRKNPPRNRAERAAIAYSFQETMFDEIAFKTRAAGEKLGVKDLFAGGGVICNERLREKLKAGGMRVHFPPKELCVDNGAMIAGLGFPVWHRKGRAGEDF